MRKLQRVPWLLAAIAVALVFAPVRSRADFVLYAGDDVGVGPGQAGPNSALAASQFASSTQDGGPGHLIDFEDPSLRLDSPASANLPLALGSGVTATLSGTDHNPPQGFSFGISDGPDDVLYGYNTTPGVVDGHHLRVVPLLNGGITTLTFNFSAPIMAFGLNVTGLGTADGPLHLMFDNGTAHDVLITGSAAGGLQFVGFDDPGAAIRQVSFQFQGVLGVSRDVFGVDDVQFVGAVPEPSSLLLGALGGLALLGARRLRRGTRPLRG